jgi:CDP-diacylglycerol---glycerol-3-phosphate 3-phosphatidyltransferase
VSNEQYPAGVEPDPTSPSERHPDTPAPDPETSPWNVPNALTAFRIVLVPVFAWMLLAHPDEPGWRLLTAGVFTLAILTDSLDGYLARRHNLATKFGKLADPIADKALTGTALICLSVIGELWWWATVVILVREWGITVLRFAMLRYGVMAAGRGGKIKTFVQAIAIILYLLPLGALAAWSPALAAVATWVAVAAMLAAVVLTVVTGLDYLREAFRLRRQSLSAR